MSLMTDYETWNIMCCLKREVQSGTTSLPALPRNAITSTRAGGTEVCSTTVWYSLLSYSCISLIFRRRYLFDISARKKMNRQANKSSSGS